MDKAKIAVEEILDQVRNLYPLGEIESFEVVEAGYEDLNIKADFSGEIVLVKVFHSGRGKEECQSLVEIMNAAVRKDIRHPELYEPGNGKLSEVVLKSEKRFLCVMDYVEGGDLRGESVDREDARSLGQQAAKISSLDVEPLENYDSWAIPNFPEEYEKCKSCLTEEEQDLIKPVLEKFKQIDLSSLPHSFVHGDLRETNLIRDPEEKLWVIDFSVSGFYPRVQELAVICSTVLLEESSEKTQENIEALKSEYRENAGLKDREEEALPILAEAGCAMNFLKAAYLKRVEGVESEENEYWLRKGREGLEQDWSSLV